MHFMLSAALLWKAQNKVSVFEHWHLLAIQRFANSSNRWFKIYFNYYHHDLQQTHRHNGSLCTVKKYRQNKTPSVCTSKNLHFRCKDKKHLLSVWIWNRSDETLWDNLTHNPAARILGFAGGMYISLEDCNNSEIH